MMQRLALRGKAGTGQQHERVCVCVCVCGNVLAALLPVLAFFEKAKAATGCGLSALPVRPLHRLVRILEDGTKRRRPSAACVCVCVCVCVLERVQSILWRTHREGRHGSLSCVCVCVRVCVFKCSETGE